MVEQNERSVLKNSALAARQFSCIAHKLQEHFAVMTIDAHGHPIQLHIVALGTANRVEAHPRDIFRVAITDNAVSIMIAHNHPSGEVVPSEDDVIFTERIAMAGHVLGIPVMDSFVLAGEQAMSMREIGCLSGKPVELNGKEIKCDEVLTEYSRVERDCPDSLIAAIGSLRRSMEE